MSLDTVQQKRVILGPYQLVGMRNWPDDVGPWVMPGSCCPIGAPINGIRKLAPLRIKTLSQLQTIALDNGWKEPEVITVTIVRT